MLSGLNNTLEFMSHPFERVQLFILGLYLKEKTTSINSWWLCSFVFFLTSETRLVEIMEGLCEDSASEVIFFGIYPFS